MKQLLFSLLLITLFLPAGFSQFTIIPDSSFGKNGQIESSGQEEFLSSLFVQKNNKIVCAGKNISWPTSFYLTRYNKYGLVDSTFGNNGEVITTIPDVDVVQVACEQKDGKIICAGAAWINNVWQIALIRYTQNGLIDSGFGTYGLVTGNETSGHIIRSLAITNDNKIIVLADASYTEEESLLLCFLPNGQPDNSFGVNGKTYFKWQNGNAGQSGPIAIQHDNKIIIGATRSLNKIDLDKYFIGLKRFLPNGNLDSAYGMDGELSRIWSGNLLLKSIKTDENDKLIMLCNTFSVPATYTTFVIRLNKNGKPDYSFGNKGITYIDRSPSIYPCNIIIQPDKKMLLPFMVITEDNKNNRFGLMRTGRNGKPDISFGNNGVQLTLPVLDSGHVITTAVLRPDGALIAGGEIHVETKTELYVHRRINCFKAITATSGLTAMAAIKENLNDVRVFPNPVKDVLYIEGAAGKWIYITNENGWVVLKTRLLAKTSAVQLGHLNAGIYFLKTEGIAGKSVKIIKTE